MDAKACQCLIHHFRNSAPRDGIWAPFSWLLCTNHSHSFFLIALFISKTESSCSGQVKLRRNEREPIGNHSHRLMLRCNYGRFRFGRRRTCHRGACHCGKSKTPFRRLISYRLFIACWPVRVGFLARHAPASSVQCCDKSEE